MTPAVDVKSPGRSIGLAAKIALLVGILLFLNYAIGWFAKLLAYRMCPRHFTMALFALIASVVSYTLLWAIPFLPGIEVGLMLMAMLGVKGIILVYCCTILALSLSFLFGRLLPPRDLERALGWFHLKKARDLVLDLAPLDEEDRLRFLLQRAPSRVRPLLPRPPCPVVAV